MRRRLFVCMAMLTACGAIQQVPPSRSAGVLAQPSTPLPGGSAPLNIAPAIPGHERLDFSRPITQKTAGCGDWGSGGPPSLQQYLAATSPTNHFYQSAALVSVTGIAAAVYNTPDGARWTQAWLDTGHEIHIYTPYELTIKRSLRGGLQAGQVIRAYAEGGAVGADSIVSCVGHPTGTVSVSTQAVVFFGDFVSDVPAGLSQGPRVTVFDVVEGSAVLTVKGVEPLP